MKAIKMAFFAIILASLASCASAIKFPVSGVTPAAVITIETEKLSDNNYMISLEMENLSSPLRLTPTKNLYVIWAVSESGFTRNIGYFLNDNAESIGYKATFPYKPAEVFITAEESEQINQPVGIEISRVNLR